MRFAALIGVLALTACRFNSEPPGQLVITCSSDAECSHNLVCDPASGRCVSAGNRLSLTSSVTPAVGTSGTVFTATATLQTPGALSGATVRLLSGRTEVGRFAEVADLPLTWRYTATGSEPEGVLRALADFDFGAGQRYFGVELGQIMLDLTAPQVFPGTLKYLLAEDNPLLQAGFESRARAATIGTIVEISVAVSEIPAVPPTATVECGGAAEPGLLLNLSSSRDRQLVFTGKVTAVTRPGACAVRARITDSAGNTVDQPIDVVPALVIDADPPPAPHVDLPRALVLHRAPVSALQGGPAQYLLSAGPGAIDEPGALVVSAPFGGVFATLVIPESRELSVALSPRGDPVSAEVRLLDWAGNSSPWVAVRDYEFVVANLVRGSVRGVPELRRGALGASLLGPHSVAANARDPSGVYLISPAKGGLMDLLFIRRDVYLGTSVDLPRPLQVPARTESAMVAWKASIVGPYGRFVFGGLAPNGALLDDLWTLDGLDRATQVPRTGPWPQPRRGHTLADAPRPTLFGGMGAQGALGDAWELRVDGGWSALPSGPPPRHRHATAYSDPQGLVVVGGVGADGGVLDDVWRFAAGAWSELPFRLPEPRAAAQVIFSPDGLAVAGGFDRFGAARETFWLRDAGWHELAPVSPRAGGALLWASPFWVRNSLVGGVVAPGVAAGTVTEQRANGDWVEAPLHSYALEVTRHTAIAAYDPNQRGVVFAGGTYLDPGNLVDVDARVAFVWAGDHYRRLDDLQDTWVNGAYSPSLDKLVGFSSPNGSVYELDGGAWVYVAAAPLPSLAYGAPIIASPAAGPGLFAIAGQTLLRLPDATRAWEPAGVSGSVPDSRALGYRANGALISVSGFGAVHALVDGGWQAVASSGPGVLCAAWDPDREAFNAVGGSVPQWWHWSSDAGWFSIGYDAGAECSVGYDPARRRTVALTGELIELDGFGARAHLDITVDPAVAGLGPTTLEGVEIWAVAGGDGWRVDGSPLPGVEVVAFARSSSAAGHSVATADAVMLDAADAGFPRLSRPFPVRVQSLGPNARNTAQLEVKSLNVLLRLRR